MFSINALTIILLDYVQQLSLASNITEKFSNLFSCTIYL